MSDNFYNEVLIDHNLHPQHLHELPGATCSHAGMNPSCGDEITLHLTVKDGIITDGAYTGVGCAISNASADIMLDLIIGRIQPLLRFATRWAMTTEPTLSPVTRFSREAML